MSQVRFSRLLSLPKLRLPATFAWLTQGTEGNIPIRLKEGGVKFEKTIAAQIEKALAKEFVDADRYPESTVTSIGAQILYEIRSHL